MDAAGIDEETDVICWLIIPTPSWDRWILPQRTAFSLSYFLNQCKSCVSIFCLSDLSYNATQQWTVVNHATTVEKSCKAFILTCATLVETINSCEGVPRAYFGLKTGKCLNNQKNFWLWWRRVAAILGHFIEVETIPSIPHSPIPPNPASILKS